MRVVARNHVESRALLAGTYGQEVRSMSRLQRLRFGQIDKDIFMMAVFSFVGRDEVVARRGGEEQRRIILVRLGIRHKGRPGFARRNSMKNISDSVDPSNRVESTQVARGGKIRSSLGLGCTSHHSRGREVSLLEVAFKRERAGGIVVQGL